MKHISSGFFESGKMYFRNILLFAVAVVLAGESKYLKFLVYLTQHFVFPHNRYDLLNSKLRNPATPFHL